MSDDEKNVKRFDYLEHIILARDGLLLHLATISGVWQGPLFSDTFSHFGLIKISFVKRSHQRAVFVPV